MARQGIRMKEEAKEEDEKIWREKDGRRKIEGDLGGGGGKKDKVEEEE